MKDAILIMNPTSKHGKGKKNWKFFKDFDSVITTSRNDAINTVINLNKKIFVAVGGDGTINEVVNGIMKSNEKNKNEEKILGVLYSGTSPDFCKFHGIPYSPKDALNTLKNGTITNIDVCKIIDKDSNEYYFSSSINLGLGTKIASTSNKIRKFFGDFLGTFFSLIYSLITLKTFDAKIEYDCGKLEFKNLYHLFIIKNNFIASGLKFGIDAKCDDGKIYIIPLFKENVFKILKTIINLYKGNITFENLKNSKFIECKKAFIETSSKQFLEFDGDDYPISTPINVVCLNKALKIIK